MGSPCSTTRPPPSRPRSSTSPPATACTSAARWSTPPTAPGSRPSTPPPRRCCPRWWRPAPGTSTGPWPPPAGPSRALVPPAGQGAGQVPVPHRPPRAGAVPGAGGARVDRQRQAHQGEPRRRPAPGGRPLLLLRGLGRQAGPCRLRPGPPAPRRGRPGHPVELPAADAGLEDRPRPGLWQHRRAQAGRDHPADRPGLRRHLPAGRPAARRRQHRHRRGRHRPGPRRAPRRGQGGLHRLHRGRAPDRPLGGRHPQEGDPGAGGKAANIVFDDAPRPGGRGDRQRHLLQPGPRVLRRQPAAGAGVDRRRPAGPAQAPARHAAARRPAGQEHRHRCHQQPRAAGPHPRAVRRRRGRGRRALVAAVRPARPRLLVPAHRLHRRVAGPPHRPRGDLRAGAVGADLPHPRRGAGEGQQHPLRPVRRRVDRQGQPHPVDGPAPAGRVVWANTFNRFDPTSPFGGYKESGYGREGGRHGLEAYLDA